jgi:hypothetical protein
MRRLEDDETRKQWPTDYETIILVRNGRRFIMAFQFDSPLKQSFEMTRQNTDPHSSLTVHETAPGMRNASRYVSGSVCSGIQGLSSICDTQSTLHAGRAL